ncbi:MAG: glycosyltransferase family 4 protein [Anaerolineae bacterium]|nr:glycosyltransferase family 4 protein [Anaerolineae bacterium]
MHVLHVIDSLALGGAERMLVDIANATAADGHRVSVCITRSETLLTSELRPDIQTLVLGRARRFDLEPMRRFAHYVNANGVQIIHAHGRTSFTFVAFVKTLRLIGAPILLHDHYGGIETDASIPSWFRLWGRFMLDAYVGVYERLTEWAVSAGVPRHRAETIGNALDFVRLRQPSPSSLRLEQQIPVDTRIGMVICGIRQEKGVDLLLESLAQIQPARPYIVFIVGADNQPEYAERCRRQVIDLELADHVRFLGPRQDAATLAHSADFAVMPSRSESGPLVLIEYMAAGLPFAAFSVGNISRRAAQLGTPGFVPPQDAAALAREIEGLLALPDDALRQRGQIGFAVAEQEFSIQTRLPDWYRAYAKAMREV